MALGLACTTEMENILPFNATSLCMGHSVTPTAQIDDKLTISSTYKAASDSLFAVRARTFSQEDASTSSGEEDSSRCSIDSKGSEASDDDRSLSPRSSVGDMVSCVYSVMFLLRAHAGHCRQSHASDKSSVLGYRTESLPEDERVPRTKSVCERADEASSKFRKARKQMAKRIAKSQHAASVFERLPPASLRDSAADSWVAKQRARATNVDDDAKVTRAVRSILNKLTIEKFESLFHQLIDLGIKSPQHISMLMSELFEKATTQHHFIPMYAELCARLAQSFLIPGDTGDVHSFRRLLLNQCQKVFEQLLEPCDAKSSAEEEAQVQLKRRALGNIKFIGELLVQGMLSSRLLIQCGSMLLEKRVDCPEALECLAALLVVTGKSFDTKDWEEHGSLEAMFSDMQKLTKDKTTPPRVRFLLRDVLDLRSAGWRRSANQSALKAAPMKLEEVREKQALDDQTLTSSKCQPAKKSQERLPIAQACRAILGGSTKHVSVDTEARTRLARQKQNAPNKPTDSSTSLASLSADRARLRQTIASDKAQLEEKQSRHTREAIQKVMPAVAVSLNCTSWSEEQVVSLTNTPLTGAVEAFSLVSFRRELAATLTMLACDKNVAAAVQRIQSHQVPVEFQGDQFVDILSRVLEERRGAVRRCGLAFAAGLMMSDHSPFDKKSCLAGICLFFKDVYTDMCSEVQRLPAIVRTEFVPTMSGVFSASDLNEFLPEGIQMA